MTKHSQCDHKAIVAFLAAVAIMATGCIATKFLPDQPGMEANEFVAFR